MKITRSQLRKIILENLNLVREGKGNLTGPIADKIIKSIKDSGGNDYVIETAVDTVMVLEGVFGKDLCEIIEKPAVQEFLKDFGYVSHVGARAFKAFTFVAGSFFALPAMINRHLKTLNTVPGKLRSIRKLLDRPLNPEDVARSEVPDDLFADISRNMGIERIGREEMIEFLAIGIGLEDEKGVARNPLISLVDDDIISQEFVNAVYTKYYELREVLDENKIKEDILKSILEKIEDDKEATTLSLSQMADLVSKFIV